MAQMISRRDVLRTSALAGGLWFVDGSFFSAIAAADPKVPATTNWAKSITFSAARVSHPSSEEDICRLVKGSKRFKPLGTAHSFSLSADTTETLISTQNLNKVLSLNRYPGGATTVTVQSGIKYIDLGRWLESKGFALANYASLPHISVGGSIATATHPSGTQNLAADVVSLKMITGAGNLLCLRKGDPDFAGAVVGIGALGIVTEIELRVEPAYQVRQEVYLHMSWDAMFNNFDAIFAGAYSPSIFLHWQEPDVSELWYKQRVPVGERSYAPQMELFGAKRADRDVHPVLALPADNCTPQMGVPGPSFARLPHFRPEFSPASGKELHTEIFVPWKHAVNAVRDLRALADKVGPLLYITELRSVQCDDLWLSTAYGDPSDKVLSIQFSWKFDDTMFTQNGVMAVVPEIQKLLEPYGARAHWGKLFTWDHEYHARVYPRFKDFVALARKLDPNGKLGNAFLTANVYGS